MRLLRPCLVAAILTAACSQNPQPADPAHDPVASPSDSSEVTAPVPEEAPSKPRLPTEEMVLSADDRELTGDNYPFLSPRGYEPEGPPAPRALPEDLDSVEWLVDEDGNEYHLVPLAKAHLRNPPVYLDNNVVRISYGIEVIVDHEDDDFFYVKIFKPRNVPSGHSQQMATAEEIAEVTATFDFELATDDRVSLESMSEGLPSGNLWRNGFDLADMNGDGHLDIVHSQARRDRSGPHIFLGDSKGGWSNWKEARYPPLPFEYGDAAAGDFDQDGRQDFAVGVHARGVRILLQKERGVFTDHSEGIGFELPGHTGKAAFTSRQVEVVDWNRDGWLDVVALSEGPRGFEHVEVKNATGMRIFLNQGDGAHWKEIGFDPEDKLFGDALGFADFDGDGLLDMYTGSLVMGEKKLVRLARPGLETWEPMEIPSHRELAWTWAATAGDVDGDGRPDLVVSYYSFRLRHLTYSGLDVLLNRETGWERRAVVADAKGELNYHALTLADLDADGNPDIVAGSRNGQLHLYLGRGDGSFVFEQESDLLEPVRGCRAYELRSRNLDGHPGDELVVNFAGENCRNLGSIQAFRVR